MRRSFPATSLFLACAAALASLTAGCSRENPPQAEQHPASVQAAVPDPAPAGPAPAAPDPKPAVPAASKPAKPKVPAAKAQTGSPMDRFAKCLTEQGAVMYGIFWCDHCREQKEKFGDSFQYVKYVECVTPDAPRTPTGECKAQGIKHTPTWIFSDGSRVEGAQPLAVLAEKTGCKAP